MANNIDLFVSVVNLGLLLWIWSSLRNKPILSSDDALGAWSYPVDPTPVLDVLKAPKARKPTKAKAKPKKKA